MTSKRKLFNGLCGILVYAAAILTVVLLVGILGIALPAFHVVALLVPLFFPRIAIMFRPLFKGLDERKEDV